MARKIRNRQIERLCIIDDDEQSRLAMGYNMEDSDLILVPQNEKVLSLESYFKDIVKQSDAVVSDHHLRKKNYFPVNGAEVVSQCYDKKIPSVLVTRYEQAVMDEIRRFRQKIPVILSPDEFDIDSLMRSLEVCENEFHGEFAPSRKIWRTLIRIDDVDDNHFFAIIPAWNPNEMISIIKRDLPKVVQDAIMPDLRLHAKVNIDASLSNDLFFTDWEIK
jgi:hypothetical protein